MYNIYGKNNAGKWVFLFGWTRGLQEGLERAKIDAKIFELEFSEYKALLSRGWNVYTQEEVATLKGEG